MGIDTGFVLCRCIFGLMIDDLVTLFVREIAFRKNYHGKSQMKTLQFADWGIIVFGGFADVQIMD